MQKKFFVGLLTIVVCITLTGCGDKNNSFTNGEENNNQQQDDSNMTDGSKQILDIKAGDSKNYGKVDGSSIVWEVLYVDIDSNRALLTTKECVRLDVFSEEDKNNWADSSIRKWLNEEFIKNFSAEETSKILTTELVTNENVNYEEYKEEDVTWTKTADKVFLLSGNEASKFFSDAGKRLITVNLNQNELDDTILRYARLFNKSDVVAKEEIEKLNGHAVEYWLRSNGRAYMVQTVGSNGEVNQYGAIENAMYKGIRPAIWIDIQIGE